MRVVKQRTTDASGDDSDDVACEQSCSALFFFKKKNALTSSVWKHVTRTQNVYLFAYLSS